MKICIFCPTVIGINFLFFTKPSYYEKKINRKMAIQGAFGRQERIFVFGNTLIKLRKR